MNQYIKKEYKTNNILNTFNKIELNYDIVFYDSCSYYCKSIDSDLDLVNKSKIKKFYLTIQDSNNKWCGYDCMEHINKKLHNFNYIDSMKYISRTQKMIVIMYEKKI